MPNNVTDQILATSFGSFSLAQLFDTLPDNVLWVRAVHGSLKEAVHEAHTAVETNANQIVDFVVEYANPKALKTLSSAYQLGYGTSIRHGSPFYSAQAEQTFQQLCRVIEQNTAIDFEYFDQTLRQWLWVTFSKAGEGVLMSSRFVAAPNESAIEAERQRALLNEVLNASPDAVIALNIICDDRDTIIDFRPTHANSRLTQLVGQPIDALLKTTILTLCPDWQVNGLFGHCLAVVQTGDPYQGELVYTIDDLDNWYSVSAIKLGEGLLLTFTDLTQARLAEQVRDEATTNLQAVIDIAQTGIFVLSPVYDEQGQQLDFRLKIVNRTLAALVGQTPDVLQGTLFSDWFTSYRDTPVYKYYKQVLETGEETYFDIHYAVDGIDEWFGVKAVRFKDDVLVTFTNHTALKQAQQTLEQTAEVAERQAELLNSVLNSSNSGVIAFGAIRDEANRIIDFNFLVANRSSLTMLDKKIEEMVGNKLLTIFPGNVESGLFDLYVKTTETGEPGRTEVYYNLDGLDFWLDISSEKLGDGFVVTFTDISEVKRTAAAVEQSADQLRTVIDSAQVAIFLISPVYNEDGKLVDFRFRTANQMIAGYVDQEPDALTGELVSRWFPEYLTNGLFQRYVAIFDTGRTQHFTFHLETATIDSWENYTVVKVGHDILVTFSDYTELKKLQQRIEASATELQTVIDTCQTGIFLFSPERDQAGEVIDFRFRLANRQLASYVGQDPEVVVGALGSTWFPDYKVNGLFEKYYETYRTGKPLRFDFHYNASGIDAWLDIMTTKSGHDVLVTFGDYTPLKQLQQQLENSVVELRRSNKNLEQFAYVASHDLQEPLRKIQAFGDLIQSQFAPVIGDSGADMITRMQSAAARMQVLIKDVLAYSRIATKRENAGPVDLIRVVSEVLSDIETAIQDKQATVIVDPLPTVRGDEAQLRQLFQNLISNALKFTKIGKAVDPPVIRLTARRLLGRELPVNFLLNKDDDRHFYLIDVIDNGIGFEPHQAERIFQVFQRLNGRSEYQGTGIGLAIVQKVIDNHQGRILAEGRPGQGSTFRILLPA
ncbi:PAS domain-containing sensor histidine kinase [Spirosoma aerophilum]